MTRANQRLRTRKDLLLAAARLLKSGRKPSMEEVAEEALVSRATAYRYFPTLEQLLIEAPLDDKTPAPEALFRGDDSTDPVARVIKAETALDTMVQANEAQLRLMLAYSLNRQLEPSNGGRAPARQNRRTALIEEALSPIRENLDARSYKRLCSALAVLFGIESTVVFRDVLSVGPREGRAVKQWAIAALVHAALKESGEGAASAPDDRKQD